MESDLSLRCSACKMAGRPLIRGVTPAGMEIACRFCGRTSTLAPDREGVVARAPDGCPKCGAPRAGSACPRCGLIYSRWRGQPEGQLAASTETRKLWAEVVKDFFDAKRHETFLAHCLHAGALHFAAAQYTAEEASPDAQRAVIAETRRKQVRALAEAAYLAPKGDREEEQRQARLVRNLMLAALAVALIALTVWMAMSLSRSRQKLGTGYFFPGARLASLRSQAPTRGMTQELGGAGTGCLLREGQPVPFDHLMS